MPRPIPPSSSTASERGWLYHATNIDSAYQIAESGSLLTHKPWHGTDQETWPDGSTQKRSYWSPRADVVWSFAPKDGQSVILRTAATKDFRREPFTGDVYTTKKVPASRIEILTDEGWIALRSAVENPGDVDACRLGKWAWDRDPEECGADPPSPSEAASRLAKKRWKLPPEQRRLQARVLRGGE